MSTSVEHAVTFACEGETLIGILHEPEAPQARVGIVIIVGGPQYRVGSHRQFVLMARALARHGWPVFRFDYRGMGDSEGGAKTFEDIEPDIRAAIDTFVERSPGLQGVVLWGLCDAASAASMYCGNDARVRGLILANPWVRTTTGEARAYLKHYYTNRLLQPAFWRKVVSGSFNPIRSVRALLTAVTQARSSKRDAVASGSFISRMRVGLSGAGGPVLVLISQHDLTAQEFMDLCAADERWKMAMAAPRVHLERLAGADHTFSNRQHLASATERCKIWLSDHAFD